MNKEPKEFITRDEAEQFGLIPISWDCETSTLHIISLEDGVEPEVLAHKLGIGVVLERTVTAAEFRLKLHHVYEGLLIASEPALAFDSPALDVATFWEDLLKDAVQRQASDIHLEPMEQGVYRMRCRIEGSIEELGLVPDALRQSLPIYLKVQCGLPIDTAQVAIDGRISNNLGYDLRLSAVPSIHGEAFVIRILEQQGGVLSLEDLGMTQLMRQKVLELLGDTDGMLLVVGPTGSGKTTTLYACMQDLLSRGRKIYTVEDPIEYELPGINQIQMNPEVGYKGAIRSLLRQFPDVMMVGEIRDLDTALAAVNASLTGHQVLSTMHAVDAPMAIMRLLDMGLQSFLLSSGLRGVIAQRLVKRKGMPGRVGIFEVLTIDKNLEEAIYKGVDIRSAALESGYKSLWEDGMEKVEAGLIDKNSLQAVIPENLATL